MKAILAYSAKALVACIILFAALNPDSGAIHQGTAASLGLALIGLGLCLKAREPREAQ